jgi:hypothetical protein
MILVFYAITVFLFPAGAVWAWRRRGGRGLALLTALVICALLSLALVAASPLGGNRLVESQGFRYTATRMLVLTVLSSILPVVASAMTVWAIASRARSGFVYPIAAATALIATAVGGTIAIYTLWR